MGTLQAIPTRYNGTQFRSRLEARWAAFFDIAGWSWQYEAVDLGGWMPDFVLVGADHPVYVEVKPICWTGGHLAVIHQVNERADLAKVRGVAAREVCKPDPLNTGLFAPEILVLGAYPQFLEEDWGNPILGVFVREEWANGYDTAVLAKGYGPQVFDFHAYVNFYGYRMGGQAEGDHHLQPVNLSEAQIAWREAGNLVQWQVRHHANDED